MDTDVHLTHDPSGSIGNNVSDVHNASVDEDAARQGGCAQVHLPTGRMCNLRHGHTTSCDFIPAEQARAEFVQRKVRGHW